MNRRLLMIFAVFSIAIIFATSVSAGILDSADSTIKTHEFNYGNKAVFNISDNLTNKTGVESILFGQGVSYDYPNNSLICFIYGIADYGGSDEVESNQNDAFLEEIQSEPTSQGYKTYIFKWDNMDEYDVYIDLNNTTVSESGFDEQYKYFKGSFQTMDEAKIFIDTFKLNDELIK